MLLGSAGIMALPVLAAVGGAIGLGAAAGGGALSGGGGGGNSDQLLKEIIGLSYGNSRTQSEQRRFVKSTQIH